MSPPGASILITSAPKSASNAHAAGAATTVASSTTRIPARAAVEVADGPDGEETRCCDKTEHRRIDILTSDFSRAGHRVRGRGGAQQGDVRMFAQASLYLAAAIKRTMDGKLAFFFGFLSCLTVVWTTMVVGTLLANVNPFHSVPILR